MDDNNQTQPTMIEEVPWSELFDSGLALFVNQFLHIFGFAITAEIDEETNEIHRVYLSRCRFRGFNQDNVTKAYEKLGKFMADKSQELLEDLDR